MYGMVKIHWYEAVCHGPVALAAIPAAIALAGTVATVAIPAITAKDQKAPPPPKLVPQDTNKPVAGVEDKARRQALAARGRNSTILTDPLGDSGTQMGAATLLGR